ncbi:MAG: hypothetical protein PQJ50_06395, partial [Spirochaetales bacterium]|nr:hypothetical protein [Spirochaetales bacterium]
MMKKSNTKSSSRRLSRQDLFVIIFFLALAIICGWFFYGELNRSLDETEGVPIGRVTAYKGLSQRRPGRQSHWSNIAVGEILYKSDSIQTGNDSEVSIYLDGADGEKADELRFGPNSYASLNLYDQVVDIFFSAGNLIATSSSGLSVSMEGTVLQVNQKSSISLEKKDGMPTLISVLEGSVSVDSGNDSREFGMDSLLYIDSSSGSVSETPLDVVVRKPKDQSILLSFAEYREVEFDWSLADNWDSPVLEVSESPDFTEFNTYRSNMVSFKPGEWFWRISDEGSGQSGEVRSFTIEKESVPVTVSPSPGRIVEYRGDSPRVLMQWNAAEFTDSYFFELSSEADFSSINFSREVYTSSIMLADLDPGEWWWRVSPVYRNIDTGTIPVQEPVSFTLKKLEDFKQTLLLSPPDRSILSSMELENGIPFRWMAQDGVENYQLLVASDREMTQSVTRWEGNGNWTALMAGADSGVYYWQVQGMVADGSSVPVSDVYSFTLRSIEDALRLVHPARGELIELPRYGSQTFLWEADVPGLASLTLTKLDGESENSGIRVTRTVLKGESYTAVLPGEGEYSWRVEIKDEAGKVLLPEVESRFTMVDEELYQPVLLLFPGDEADVELLDVLQKGLILQWHNEAEGEFIYTVEVVKDSVASVYRTASNRLVLRDLT